MQCRLRDRRSRAFKVGFRPCRLHAVISPDSLNLLMILWTVDDEIPKFLAMVRWGTLFLNCSTIFSRSCPQSGEPRAIFACEWLSNSFIPTHGTHLFPISLFTCGNFQTGVWWAFLNFLRLFGHLSQLLWNVLQPSNSKLMIIFPKKIKVNQFEHWISCLCSVLNWI